MDHQRFADIYNDTATYPTLADVAKALGCAVKTVQNQAGILRRRRNEGQEVPALVSRAGLAATASQSEHLTVPALPSKDEPIEELIERLAAAQARNHAYEAAKGVVEVQVHTQGPFAVVGLPDPHLNNVGSDIKKALRDADLIANTEGVYCIGVGDWIDNFIIGRLERARRGDVIPHADSWRLLHHYMGVIAPKMVAVISGNHMDWTDVAGGYDVFADMCKEMGLDAVYHQDEIRVRLTTPSGASFTHLVRHKFPGQSKYNSAHGVLVWLLERWQGEDVAWGGHIHQAGHISLERQWMGESRIVHGIQLSAYKKIDSYARKEGFRSNTPFMSPMVVHDPATGKTTFHDDIEDGIRYLTFLRRGC